MKKIINQKRYNTDASTLVLEWQPDNFPADDPKHVEFNRLYRKSTGEYFIHGKGGAMSPYADMKNAKKGIISAGEMLIPVSLEEATEILEKHMTPGEVDCVLGRSVTDDKKQVNIQIDSGTWNMLQMLKSVTGKSATDIMIELIRKAAGELKEEN